MYIHFMCVYMSTCIYVYVYVYIYIIVQTYALMNRSLFLLVSGQQRTQSSCVTEVMHQKWEIRSYALARTAQEPTLSSEVSAACRTDAILPSCWRGHPQSRQQGGQTGRARR